MAIVTRTSLQDRTDFVDLGARSGCATGAETNDCRSVYRDVVRVVVSMVVVGVVADEAMRKAGWFVVATLPQTLRAAQNFQVRVIFCELRPGMLRQRGRSANERSGIG